MNYESIANSVIKSAVNNHLRHELRAHCQRAAKAKASAWLRKNRKRLNAAIQVLVDKKLDAEIPNVVRRAANCVRVRANRY